MASINYGAREINVKIVYYGPGLSGKTTNLQIIHRKVPPEHKSDMVSLATETDRTLFFDFLPLDLGTIKGFSTKFQLYTVPGQVYYNATRKLVLRGVDGVVFVADSGADKIPENIESFQNLEDNLAEYRYKREEIPIIIQYNKRDLPNALTVEELHQHINRYSLPWTEAVANKGIGVFDSLKLIGKIVIDNLNRKYSRLSRGTSAASPVVGAPPRSAQTAPDTVAAPTGYDPRYYNQPQPPTPPPQQFSGYPMRGQGNAPAAPYQQPAATPHITMPPIRPAPQRQTSPYPGQQNQMPPVQAQQQQRGGYSVPPPAAAPYPPQQERYNQQPTQQPEAHFPPARQKAAEAPEAHQQQTYGFVNFEQLPIEPPAASFPPAQGRVPGNSMPTPPPPPPAPPEVSNFKAGAGQVSPTADHSRDNGQAAHFPPQQQQQRPARSKIDERDYNVYHIDAAQQSFPKSAASGQGSRASDDDEELPGKQQKGFLSKFFNRASE